MANAYSERGGKASNTPDLITEQVTDADQS
jgi:hypothetical protein